MVSCHVLLRCLTVHWSMSSKEHAWSYSEHLHHLLHVVPFSGIARRGSLFLSETWSVHHAWKSYPTVLSPSSQIQLLVSKLHFDFWLEDDWSQSKPVNLQPQLWACASTVIHKVADFARRDSELLQFTKMSAMYHNSRLQDGGIRFHCTLHMFSIL